MKKNVILYVRVSRNEQTSNNDSIVSQIEKLKDFCDIRGWNVLNIFDDNYPHSKSFDRPGYNKLKKYVRESKEKIDYLLFVQWSRFSRNLYKSLSEIQSLKKLGIEANATEQWIDMIIPENQHLLSSNLARLSIKAKYEKVVIESEESDFAW